MEAKTVTIIIQVLLVGVLLLGVMLEVKTGGLGIGALLSLAAASVFFGSKYMDGLVSLWQVGVFLAGVVCIVIEMLTPNVGLFAGIGIAAMLASIAFTIGDAGVALPVLGGATVVAIVAFAFVAKRLPESRLWKKIVLDDSTSTTQGYVSVQTNSCLKGQKGVAETELRPSGRVLVDGKSVDVVADGSFIPKGAEVFVTAVEGGRVVVRQA